MVRPLHVSPKHSTLLFSSMPITTPLFVLLSVFSIFSIITFLCGSRNMKKLQNETGEEDTGSKSKENQKKLILKLNSNLSSRALSMVKLISWKKVQAEEGEGDYRSDQDDEEALWRKNILMGERCRPLDFSGKTVNGDSEGKKNDSS